jgi:hypothetical protein
VCLYRQANADAAEREGNLEAELAVEREEVAELRRRLKAERSDNSNLRGDNEALQAEVRNTPRTFDVSTRISRAHLFVYVRVNIKNQYRGDLHRMYFIETYIQSFLILCSISLAVADFSSFCLIFYIYSIDKPCNVSWEPVWMTN